LAANGTSVSGLVSVRGPDIDLIEAEREDDVRQEAFLTLHDLSESWWSGERRRLD
jgi:hypothetical protein